MGSGASIRVTGDTTVKSARAGSRQRLGSVLKAAR